MTAEEEKILHQFETHVRQLMEKHRKVLATNHELVRSLEEERQRNQQLTQRIAKLEQEYATLKTAKMLEISTEETLSAQKRLNKLIREIDKCIALLNV